MARSRPQSEVRKVVVWLGAAGCLGSLGAPGCRGTLGAGGCPGSLVAAGCPKACTVDAAATASKRLLSSSLLETLLAPSPCAFRGANLDPELLATCALRRWKSVEACAANRSQNSFQGRASRNWNFPHTEQREMLSLLSFVSAFALMCTRRLSCTSSSKRPLAQTEQPSLQAPPR